MQEMSIFSSKSAIEKVKDCFNNLVPTNDECVDYDFLWKAELYDGRVVEYGVDQRGIVKRSIEGYEDADTEVLEWSSYDELIKKMVCDEYLMDSSLVLTNGTANYERLTQFVYGDTCITSDFVEFIQAEYSSRENACSKYEKPELGFYKSDTCIVEVIECAVTYVTVKIHEEENDLAFIALDEFCRDYEKVNLEESVIKCTKGLLSEFFGREEPIPIKKTDNGFAYVSKEDNISVVFSGCKCYFVPYCVEGEDDYGCIFDLPVARKYCDLTEDHFDYLEGFCDELFKIASSIVVKSEEVAFLEYELKEKIEMLKEECL